MPSPLPVEITVGVGARKLAIDEVTDARVAAPLRAAGQDIGRKLAGILCPVHKKTAQRVRVHFDKRGGADLQYDSCCEQLGARIGAELG
jgi:hypothetical protein